MDTAEVTDGRDIMRRIAQRNDMDRERPSRRHLDTTHHTHIKVACTELHDALQRHELGQLSHG
jgi:hypothetical protein